MEGNSDVSEDNSSLSSGTVTEQKQMTESTSKLPYTYMDLIKTEFNSSNNVNI